MPLYSLVQDGLLLVIINDTIVQLLGREAVGGGYKQRLDWA